ncbi:transglutaminase superfamily protein [Ureibacillus xyleni]|uniref:Transglutaminase superfamily protein n=1 Tax=Ureibacillus xyleni TaxID=614648 RepID=A0A285S1N5_9BACL|nr:transglutaminase-like domain-containing protein [Ureibacillus xyleni]SOB98774.1 transglutaminase superfamily protein [Ureibacillus xyleni]
MKKNVFSIVELAVYYVIVFIILREWLIPIMKLTGTGHMELILFFIALSLILSLFRIHFVVSIVIKLAYISWFIVTIYSGYSILSAEGMHFLVSELTANIGLLVQANWVSVTDPFRTLLFLVLIWMLIYLIHHWITVRMSIFYFLVLTVLFIGTLDTFTEYDGTFAIIKIILLGLITIAFLFLKRLIIESGAELDWLKYMKLVVPVILLIGLSCITAIFLPKSEPQWPDPVPFLKAAAGKGGNEEGQKGVSKVGYGEDDSNLGGPFVADDTIVFTAQSETKQYWRVETRDVYTSRGWIKSDYFTDASTVFDPYMDITHSLPVGPEEGTKQAAISMLYPYDFVVQPYGLKSVGLMDSNEGYQFLMDDNSEKITPHFNKNPAPLTNYFVEYSKPVFLYSDLKNSNLDNLDPSLAERYLQLPENLPDRVRELAVSVVEGEESVYDKARAIEMYFRQNSFRYDTDDVAIPTEDQDYVDQFLFETKIGYCDNFSTSMVVMLRSVGIPARWVKGFAGGEIIDTNGDMKTYEVTNNDAHSWVEAFIPNVGWINFEPTIGFSNTRSIDYNIETSEVERDELSVNEEKTEPDEVVEDKKDVQQKSSNGNNIFLNAIKEYKWMFLIGFIVLVGAALLLYLKRTKWIPKVYVKFNRKKKLDESSFELMYLQLLKILEMKGFKRQKGQTLQSFAKEIDRYFETNHMGKMTNAYEQYIYAKDSAEVDFNQMKESWEYLINRATS